MVSLDVIFWGFVLLFALIGATRGWAKELIVTFSVVLGMFILTVLEKFVPFVQVLPTSAPLTLFWLRTGVLMVLVFFGYQTPSIAKMTTIGGKLDREKIQDSLLGMFIGALNGFLAVGALWYYLHQANYPFSIIHAPDAVTGQAALRLIPFLAPHWLGSPVIYFAVAVAFVLVIVVFI